MPAQATSECRTASRAGKTNLGSVQKKHQRDRETAVLLVGREAAVPAARAGSNRRNAACGRLGYWTNPDEPALALGLHG
jgi:hypothetical protein